MTNETIYSTGDKRVQDVAFGYGAAFIIVVPDVTQRNVVHDYPVIKRQSNGQHVYLTYRTRPHAERGLAAVRAHLPNAKLHERTLV